MRDGLTLVARALVLDRRAAVLTGDWIALARNGMGGVAVSDQLADLLDGLVHAGHQAQDGDEEEQIAEESAQQGSRATSKSALLQPVVAPVRGRRAMGADDGAQDAGRS